MPHALALPVGAAWPAPRVRTARTAAWELAAIAAVLAVHVWLDSRHVCGKPARAATSAAAIVVLGAVLLRQWAGPAELGIAPRDWTAGTAPLFGATALAAGGILAVAWGRAWTPRDELVHWLKQVWLLEGLQQLLLHVAIRPRVAQLLPGRPRWATAGAAGLFAALHAPNPVLMPLTFVAAWFWQEWFLRRRNLPALWLSHLALGAALFAAWDGPWLRRLRVGAAWCFAAP